VIIYPTNAQQARILADFMQEHIGLAPSNDSYLLAWAEAEEGRPTKLQLVVALNSKTGSTMQIHVAMAPGFHFTPKIMLERVFEHAFNDFKIKKLIGIVNSLNEKALRYDFHLGFVEEFRMPGLHDDGGDIVILTMTPEQCRYLKKAKVA
jgi:hypothetical protein